MGVCGSKSADKKENNQDKAEAKKNSSEVQ